MKHAPKYVASGFSWAIVLSTLLCLLTVPAIAQRGRDAGPAERPNMLDDSDVVLRPPFSNSVDLVPNPYAPQGRIDRFTMKSTDSKIYKGISRDKPGEVVPYERSVAIYIPAQYVAGTPRRSSSCRTDTTRSTTTRCRLRSTI